MSEAHSYTGAVVGGPLDGKTVVNNAPKGFVALSLTTDTVSVYDYSDDTFQHQFDAPVDEEKLGKAQMDGGRSVMVVDAPQSGEAEDIPEWDAEESG